ncbi:unnamed protein product [Tilletia controversa]|nr:unnamed protein product [Tilletia controversa]
MLPCSITALLPLLALASALPLQDMRLASGGESINGRSIDGRSDKLDNAPPAPKLPPIALPPIGDVGQAPPTSGLPPFELPPIGEGSDKPKNTPAPGWLPPHVHKPTFKFPPKGGEPTGDILPLSHYKHSGDANILSMPIPVHKSNWNPALSTVKDDKRKLSP